MRIAIQGLGRIGRLTLRRALLTPGLEVVAVNDLGDPRSLAHLVKYDSVHGRAPFPVAHTADALVLNGRVVPCGHVSTPGRLPFGDLGAEVVLDCTGRARHRTELDEHLHGSVTHVLAGSLVEGVDLTVLPGINETTLDPGRHIVVSAATGSSHALGLLLKGLDDAFGVEAALATVVHAYTSEQKILDLPHPDLRKSRAAAASMIPAPTSSVEVVMDLLPHLRGRLEGMAVRVPTPDVSLVDLTATLGRDTTVEVLNATFDALSQRLPGLVEINEDELVSADLVGCSASCAFDPFLTKVLTPRFVKVYGWFDNEWAYACRLVELVQRLNSSDSTASPSGAVCREVHPCSSGTPGRGPSPFGHSPEPDPGRSTASPSGAVCREVHP